MGAHAIMVEARLRPERAAAMAERVADPWFHTQSFAWVGRFAPPPPQMSALERARDAARQGKDGYQRGAVLAWPIRAALEVGQAPLAHTLQVEALARVEAVSLLFQASFPGGHVFWTDVLSPLPDLCPPAAHWRATRVYRDIGNILESADGAAARAFVEALPPGKVRERGLRARP